MKQCPIFVPQPIALPSVPAQVKADIPTVPQPFSDLSSSLNMGGTTVPQDSTYVSQPHRLHQVLPPHAQNSPTPCSVIDLPEKDEDPNGGSRRCYQILDPIQGMVGRVCSTTDTDGNVYSPQTYEKKQNGNADWVRGNQFGWNYSRQEIEERPKYVFSVPQQKPVYKQQVSLNPFFPYEGYQRDKDAWVPDPAAGYPEFPKSNLSGRTFKTYPHLPSYVEGRPDWVDDQVGTRQGSRTGWVELKEGFEVDGSSNKMFWVAVVVLLASWISMSR